MADVKFWKTVVIVETLSMGREPPDTTTTQDVLQLINHGEEEGMLRTLGAGEAEELSVEGITALLEEHGVEFDEFIGSGGAPLVEVPFVGTVSRTELSANDKLVNERVRVISTPESNEYAGGDMLFWLHTTGMAKFGRPELEMRRVSAHFVGAAGAMINGWASYSISREIKIGERINGPGPLNTVFMARPSTQTGFWEGRACIEMTPHIVHFECTCIGGHGQVTSPGESCDP